MAPQKPKGKGKGKGKDNDADKNTLRVKSGKELRNEYKDLKNSPDGLDMDPLTVAKCVECGHCGWPVWPRDAKVATSKTYARAGIQRGANKKKGKDGEGGEKEGEGEGEEDDEDDADSRDTMEQLQDELEDIKEKYNIMESEMRDLTKENEYLSNKLQETETALEEAQEKVEFLEEAQIRWREKLTAEKEKGKQMLHTLEHAWLVSADRETALVNSLRECTALKKNIALWKRRRNLMMDNLEKDVDKRDAQSMFASLVTIWRVEAVRATIGRKLEALELRRQREVQELNGLLEVERDHVRKLTARGELLTRRMKAAGHRYLQRALGTGSDTAAWPWAPGHAFAAWTASHPGIKWENAHNVMKEARETAEKLCEEANADKARMSTEIGELTEELAAKSKKLEEVEQEVAFLMKELESASFDKEGMKDRRAEEEARERERLRQLEELKQELADAKTALDEAEEDFELQLRALQSRLAAAEAAAAAAGGSGLPTSREDKERVVPPGQGVLCVGCLKQLVHRSVKPLPPAAALKEYVTSSARGEKVKRAFFMKELNGMPDAEDEIHSEMVKQRRDPYGLERLNLFPSKPVSKPVSKSMSSVMSSSMTSIGSPKVSAYELDNKPTKVSHRSAPRLPAVGGPAKGSPHREQHGKMRQQMGFKATVR